MIRLDEVESHPCERATQRVHLVQSVSLDVSDLAIATSRTYFLTCTS
jgi:hypothetical protein